MKDFSLLVKYEDDLGVNLGLKAAATKAKLEIGGNLKIINQRCGKSLGSLLKPPPHCGVLGLDRSIIALVISESRMPGALRFV